ncbi:MAG: DUF3078 domain-containing protein [Bacteroidales bacterium]|nr:DUF3078 domain-containing protein [Bacteroidales bacterium]
MKQLFILATMLAAATMLSAQESATDAAKPAGQWSTSTTPALKASEFMFNNWSSAGNSRIDVTGTFFGNYKYKHPKFVWDNIVDLAYGYAWQDLDNTDTAMGGRFETHRKSNDKIDLTSALSWNAYKGWGASFTANLKTQFGYGYAYDGIGPMAEETKQLVSGFFAPAYLTTALSFEHKKDNWLVSLSFLTGKTTFVCNDSLIIHDHTYGVIQDKKFDPSDPGTYNLINHAYFALGSYVKGQYLKKDILPKLDLYARVELFYDYRKPKNMAWDNMIDPETGLATNESKYILADGETFEDLSKYSWTKRRAFETDLDFELKLDYRLSEHIAANFATNLKWDTDFSGIGKWGHWQVYQMAGIQIFFNWKTPKS